MRWTLYKWNISSVSSLLEDIQIFPEWSHPCTPITSVRKESGMTHWKHKSISELTTFALNKCIKLPLNYHIHLIIVCWGYYKGTLWNDTRNIDDLVQECSNSNVLAMELLQSCIKPSISSLKHRYKLNDYHNHIFRATCILLSTQNIFIHSFIEKAHFTWSALKCFRIMHRSLEKEHKLKL